MGLLDNSRKGKSLYNGKAKYKSFAHCVADFAVNYNQDIFKFAKFLIHNQFYESCNVYVRIGYDDYIKLNSENSKKSILFVLDYLDDSSFRKEDDFYFSDYHELMNILIDEDDLLFFEPLKSQIFDVRVGHAIFEGIAYGNINQELLEQEKQRYFEEIDKISKERWDKLASENQQEEQVGYDFSYQIHPSLDTNNPNHAPELLLAIQSWEAKYLNDEYTHHEHTPAIQAFLKKKGVENSRLRDRISAVTNPKKKI